MICLITRQINLVKGVQQIVRGMGLTLKVVHPDNKSALSILYDPEVHAAVVDTNISSLSERAWLDLLESLARRIPVIMLMDNDQLRHPPPVRFAELLTCLYSPEANDIVELLVSCGILQQKPGTNMQKVVPIFNAQVPLNMLQNCGALSVLNISANGLRKIATEYGLQAYGKMQTAFQRVLFEMWGAAGCFRQSDVLMRRSASSNTYYVFLEQSRLSQTVPSPGLLERLADRVAVRLQNALWNELGLPKNQRTIPDFISVIPEFSIGHATTLYNPCFDTMELIEQLFETSQETARVHMKRMKDRQRELLQTVIQGKDMLSPVYQGIFYLQKLTKQMVTAAEEVQNCGPLMPLLFGFESLIRIRRETVDQRLAGDDLVYLESKHLRPDVLFELAHGSKVALELDQVCLRLGISGGAKLPGRLMVNILPRNLYHVAKLPSLFEHRKNIIFEISESESIGNLGLLEEARRFLRQMNASVAADDFGKGYGNLERIFLIRPEYIKLDRTLIKNIHQDGSKRAFVKGVVEAAKLNQSLVLAEGVEKWEEAEVLQDMGIDLIQGFLLHKPQEVAKIIAAIPQEDNIDLSDFDNVA